MCVSLNVSRSLPIKCMEDYKQARAVFQFIDRVVFSLYKMQLECRPVLVTWQCYAIDSEYCSYVLYCFRFVPWLPMVLNREVWRTAYSPTRDNRGAHMGCLYYLWFNNYWLKKVDAKANEAKRFFFPRARWTALATTPSTRC